MDNQLVWVVYCDENQQYSIHIPYQQNMTAQDALDLSRLAEQVQLPDPVHMGIFGLKISLPEQYMLKAGDRLEIYRPLTMNPKDVRRRRAAQNPIATDRKGNQWKKQHKID